MALTAQEVENYIKDTCYPKVLCSARCKHNDGNGYYNLCKHPCTANPRPSSGITRYYVGKCELLEELDNDKSDGGELSIVEINTE